MDLSILSTYISPIIVIVCLAIGYVIKNALPGETVNRFIPLIMFALGIIFSVWYTGTLDLPTVTAGAISGLASTGLYEAFSNFIVSKKVLDLDKYDHADRSDDTKESQETDEIQKEETDNTVDAEG